jgi:hypothetical protein
VRGNLALKVARACPVVAVLATVVLLLLSLGTPETGAASSPYVDFDRHDTYAALSEAEQLGVTTGELAGGAGEISLVSEPHSVYDDLGSYNGGSHYWG